MVSNISKTKNYFLSETVLENHLGKNCRSRGWCFTVYPVDAESKSFFWFWLGIKFYHWDLFLLLLSGTSREPCLRDMVYIKQEMERKFLKSGRAEGSENILFLIKKTQVITTVRSNQSRHGTSKPRYKTSLYYFRLQASSNA